MTNPRVVVSMILLRRAIGVVVRSGRLPPAHADVVRRLATHPLTCLRLPVALGVTDVSLQAAQEVAQALAELGVTVKPADLVTVWRTAYAVTDRAGFVREPHQFSPRVTVRYGADEAARLSAAVADPVRGAVLHLLGAEVDELPGR